MKLLLLIIAALTPFVTSVLVQPQCTGTGRGTCNANFYWNKIPVNGGYQTQSTIQLYDNTCRLIGRKSPVKEGEAVYRQLKYSVVVKNAAVTFNGDRSLGISLNFCYAGQCITRNQCRCETDNFPLQTAEAQCTCAFSC